MGKLRQNSVEHHLGPPLGLTGEEEWAEFMSQMSIHTWNSEIVASFYPFGESIESLKVISERRILSICQETSSSQDSTLIHNPSIEKKLLVLRPTKSSRCSSLRVSPIGEIVGYIQYIHNILWNPTSMHFASWIYIHSRRFSPGSDIQHSQRQDELIKNQELSKDI